MPELDHGQEMIALKSSLTMSVDNETAEVMVYGVIVSSTAFYRWMKLDTDDKSASDFDKVLKDAKASGAKTLHLRINSPGGLVPQAMAMRTMLLGAQFENIVITVDGICASAATLLTCIPNAHVRMAEGAEYMIHRPRYGAWGTADDLASALQRLQATQETACGIYASHTKQSEDQITAWMNAETWFTAQKAVDAGFAHEVFKGEQAVACVTPQMMQTMRGLYAHVPESVAETKPQEPVSNDHPRVAAGESTENTNNSEEDTATMEIKDMTPDQLRAANPALYDSVMNTGGEAERMRLDAIDALTPPGYESMAAEAKKNGTTEIEYNKMIVKAHREKGPQFLANRKEETAGAAQVPGASSEEADNYDSVSMIDKNAKEMAAIAKSMRSGTDGTMY